MVNTLKVLKVYHNMPMRAQHLPNQENVQTDFGIDLELVQCEACGTVQLTNEPVTYYKEVIRAVAISEEMKAFRLKQFQAFIKENQLEGKKILEVGSGNGEFLDIMCRCNVDAYGIEYGENGVKMSKAKGLRVEKTFIEDDKIKVLNAPFDAFYILNYLEHVPSPRTFLRGICAQLKENAVGLVEVPNFNMMIKERLFSEFTLDHLVYFTEKDLRLLLQMSGFEVLNCKSIWNDYILSATVRKRSSLNIGSFNSKQDQIIQAIRSYIGDTEREKIAIWGAGHQAFAIMAMAKLNGKVSCVVDSATFKQGKLTPVTHIPIVSPQYLAEKNIEKLIIMAGSYSDEISCIAKEKYHFNKVALLRSWGIEIK